jgi:hypothetical protein
MLLVPLYGSGLTGVRVWPGIAITAPIDAHQRPDIIVTGPRLRGGDR